ncbi:MAG: hypothetical protein IJV24_03075 [Prevotella sp.]|nr:hypothetical protein [Prevotella sp.]
MHLIEPCCTPKHLLALRHKLGENGTALFHGYGDLSLAELLPPMLTRYSEVEMLFVAPFLPDAATAIFQRMMQKQWPTMDGKGKLNVIAHLTLITDLSEKRSPLASTWLKENPFGDRLTLHNVQQNDTAILLPDLALYGPINLTYGHHFTAMATKNARTIAALRSEYERLLR